MRGSVLLAQAAADLRAAGIGDGMRDARRLLAFVLDLPMARLSIALHDPISEADQEQFHALITRRAAREPVSHLTGSRLFYGRDFIVTSDVLDPRPETETLIEAALSEPFGSVLDLGTGSGCILLTLLCERPTAVGIGADLSTAALGVAARNRLALDCEGRAVLEQGSWYSALNGHSEEFDLIVSNPPYIALDEMPGLSPEVRNHEPRMALTDEADGLNCYRQIIAGHGPYLARGGRLMVEIGPTQGQAVAQLMAQAGLHDIRVIADLDGRDRVVTGRSEAISQ
jgi:release factor glutamine methyltransferase